MCVCGLEGGDELTGAAHWNLITIIKTFYIVIQSLVSRCSRHSSVLPPLTLFSHLERRNVASISFLQRQADRRRRIVINSNKANANILN